MSILVDPATWRQRYSPSPAEALAATPGWLVDPDMSAVADLDPEGRSWHYREPTRYWAVSGNTVGLMPARDRNAAPVLAVTKAELERALARSINVYAAGRGYDFQAEVRLNILWNGAIAEGKPVRRSLLAQIIAWRDALHVEYTKRRDGLLAARTDAEAVAAADTDWSAFDASDPGVTVADAIKEVG